MKLNCSSCAYFFSNQSSTAIFDALSNGANVNVDPLSNGTNVNVDPCNMGGSHMNNSNSEGLPPWYQSFSSLSSTELLSAFMPPTSFPLVKVLSLFPSSKFFLSH